MTITQGFKLIKEQDISELKTRAMFFYHVKTGAQLLSLSNNDENKVFGITFRTPPADSTGVAHILEHSVLCGSQRYPVKEPFVELMKGSLKTFLNAFTYPDKTCYPVASQNKQDFYNLIDVYLDAVFYPRLISFIFQQEGWHFELEKPNQPLTYKGIVFNEMKGAYSSPDNILTRYSLQSLFPDNTYGFDSGGHPRHIPDLTFEQFRAFHSKFYHPSNSRIWFYGNDDPDERLMLINGYLKDFDPIQTDLTIKLQSSFDRPRRSTHPFMVGEEKKNEAKGMVTLNWLLCETQHVELNFALRILEYILLGMPASPLRKALIDSGLGEDIVGEGLGNELIQTYFSTGLRGIKVKNAQIIECLIIDTLTELAQGGIDPNTVEAALNTIEFRLREQNTGSFPRGLQLMLRSLTSWLYDGDPLALLAFEAPLKDIKHKAEKTPSYFEDIIDSLFLKNPHRTTLILEPNPNIKEKEETYEKDRLIKARSAMNLDELNAIIENTRELKRLQETPDPPEALATIPILELKDLDRKNKVIPTECLNYQGTPILFHDLFTNSIAYLDLGFNLHTLPDKYLPYIPLFGRSLVEIGTEKEDYVALTQRISRKTGGIIPQLFTSPVKDATHCAAWLFLRSKAMLLQAEELTGILNEVLLDLRLDNQKRFRQMVLEEKARQEEKILSAGHQVVNLRLQAYFDEAHWAAEQMGGVSYLFFLKKLIRDVDENWSYVLSVLEGIRNILINRKSMMINITLDGAESSYFEPHVKGLLEAISGCHVGETDWSPKRPSASEGMTLPSHINYVGKGANLFSLGYRFHGSALVITRHLRNTWLWDRVRVQGGAYGAFCLFDHLSGILTLVSYRDPNLIETLEVFDQAARFLRDLDISDKELTKSIIGTIGDLDAHMLPDAKGYVSMLRYLSCDTEELRQQMRDEVLGTKIADFKIFANVLDQVKDKGIVKILSSSNAIQVITTDRPGWLDVVNVL